MSEEAPAIKAIEGRRAMRAAISRVIGEARQSLWLLSHQLESGIYRHSALIDEFRQHLLANRRLQVKLIVSEPALAIRQAESLVELSRRLPSRFEIREPDVPEHHFDQEVVIADRRAYFLREDSRSRVARCALADPAGAHRLCLRFEDHWQNSQPCMEFRRLGI